MIFSGMSLRLLGPRACAVTGGLLFGSGWMIASFGQDHFVLTILGIGLFAGIGGGLAYVVPIAVCVQWFPERKGLVTGIAVAGFGGGAAVVGQAAGWLIFGEGLSPFAVFGLFGLAFLVLVPLAGGAMQFVPEFREKGVPRLPIRQFARSKEFKVLYAAMIGGLAAGFAINANLKDLSAAAEQVGVLAVSLFALANAAGRLAWGAVFDRVRTASALRANLLLQVLTVLSGIWLLRAEEGVLAFAMLAGFNYGGVLVVYASSVARIWGREHVGQVYGVLFSANILAAGAPVLAGSLFGSTGSFDASLLALAALLTGGAVILTTAAPRLNAITRSFDGTSGPSKSTSSASDDRPRHSDAGS
jgi:OFA family oxalate/formate antiporter-like MFS transporter